MAGRPSVVRVRGRCLFLVPSLQNFFHIYNGCQIPQLVSVRAYSMLGHFLLSTTDPELKRTIATEIRDFHDLHRDPADISRYLTVALPILIQALRNGEPSFKKDSPEHVSYCLSFVSSPFHRLSSIANPPYAPHNNSTIATQRKHEAVCC